MSLLVNTVKFDKKKHNKFVRRYEKWAYLFILPAAIFLITFSYIPLILSFFRSFKSYSSGEFVGFNNFRYILKTPAFTQSLVNVLLLSGLIVVIQVVFSFLMGQLIYSVPKKIGNIVKIAIYIPNMMSGVITAIIFNLLFRYNRGLLDGIMITLGKDPIYFAQDGVWPYVCVVAPTVWIGFGYNSILMLSGRLNIPKEYYEAASIDGASALQKMFRITIPNMGNYMVLMLVNLITANLQMLEIPLMITGGGPSNATLTPAMYLFQAFNNPMNDRNVSIAGSFLVMIPITVLNIIAFKCIKTKGAEE